MENKTENKFGETKFQFLFYVNDNIVCQRYIEIRNYNPNCKNSYEIKEMYDRIAGTNNGQYGLPGIIPKHLKNKSSEYLWKQYAYNNLEINSEENKLDRDKEFNLKFEVRVDNESIVHGSFDGRFYKTKHVDIKDVIQDIIKEMRYYMSLENYEKKYIGYTLESSQS